MFQMVGCAVGENKITYHFMWESLPLSNGEVCSWRKLNYINLWGGGAFPMSHGGMGSWREKVILLNLRGWGGGSLRGLLST